MSNRVKLLPKEISARIAAGEVVKNPASVVKELVENSIDAGASFVTVEIKKGGTEHIRVTDNGSGIHPDDVELAVLKHSTSKIRTFDDISKINTLGFRGEALASIIAVSNVEIKTQMSDMPEGRIFSNRGLNGTSIKPAGFPAGTTVIVDDLFYNIPARHKFLRSSAQEAANITDLMSRLIMSEPSVSFKYINNGNTVYHSPGSGELKDAVSAVYGRDLASSLLKVYANSDGVEVLGFVSGVNTLFKSTKNISIYINDRYIISKSINEAVCSAYSERLLKGHFPFACLHINVDPESLDVNIHPNKTSVLCDCEDIIKDVVVRAITDVLDKKVIPGIVINHHDNEKKEAVFENKSVLNTFEAENIFSSDDYAEKSEIRFEQSDIFNTAFDSDSEVTENDETDDIFSCDSINSAMEYAEKLSVENEAEKQDITADFIDYKLIGTAFDTYLIIQCEDKIYYIDQHAAHERLNYEELKKKQTISSQILLLPFVMNLNAHDHYLLVNSTDKLEPFGFDIEDFGGNTIKVSAVPNIVDQKAIQPLIEDVIDVLREGTDSILMRDKIIRKACKMSIKAGDALSSREIKTLINDINSSDIMPTCPHGRPIAVVLTKDEIEKSFKRKI